MKGATELGALAMLCGLFVDRGGGRGVGGQLHGCRCVADRATYLHFMNFLHGC